MPSATPILAMLQAWENRKNVRFCMPGHKGRDSLWSEFARFDITELPGTDNLLAPEGCIARSQELTAAAHHAAHAFYGVNGSSGCILAMFSYFRPGDTVLVARDFHRSVENAIRVSGVRPVYIPVRQRAGEMPALPETADILAAMAAHPEAKAVFVTYPNYYGMCLPLAEIARNARKQGMLLLADSAHGAHLPFSPGLPPDAGRAGADLWCVSYHKTLRAMNQTAVTFASSRVDAERLKRAVNCFQTTSPSYPLLASIESARAEMVENGREEIAGLLAHIRSTRAALAADGIAAEKTDDPTKLVLLCGAGQSGFALAQRLHERGIEVEGADLRHVLLLASIANTKEDFDRLADVVRETAAVGEPIQPGPEYLLRAEILPENGSGGEWVLPSQAPGRTAAASVFAYPPGVPLWLADQPVREEDIALLASLQKTGYNLIGAEKGIFVRKQGPGR